MYIRARVTPGAKRECITRIDETTFAVAVREPAQRNLANTRVRELIAAAYNVSPADVRILTGHRSSQKVLSVESG